MGGKVSWGAITIKRPDLDLSEWEHAVVKDGKLDPVTTQVFADWLEEREDETSKGWRKIRDLFPMESMSYTTEWLWFDGSVGSVTLKAWGCNRSSLDGVIFGKLKLFTHYWEYNNTFRKNVVYYPTPFAALCDLAQALSTGD